MRIHSPRLILINKWWIRLHGSSDSVPCLLSLTYYKNLFLLSAKSSFPFFVLFISGHKVLLKFSYYFKYSVHFLRPLKALHTQASNAKLRTNFTWTRLHDCSYLFIYLHSPTRNNPEAVNAHESAISLAEQTIYSPAEKPSSKRVLVLLTQYVWRHAPSCHFLCSWLLSSWFNSHSTRCATQWMENGSSLGCLAVVASAHVPGIRNCGYVFTAFLI